MPTRGPAIRHCSRVDELRGLRGSLGVSHAFRLLVMENELQRRLSELIENFAGIKHCHLREVKFKDFNIRHVRSSLPFVS
ncbi:hypothetical protein ACFX13_046035 [Malus domestica]